MALKITHVVDQGAWGGLATFLTNILSSQLQDPGVEDLHLICDPDEIDPALKALSVKLHFYKSDRRFYQALKIARAIHRQLEEIKPDVVILHSSFPGLWGRMMRNRPWKIIYCAHGFAFLQRVSWFKRMAYLSAEAVLSHRCDALVSISQSEYDAAKAAGIRPGIHRLIAHGVKPVTPSDEPALDVDPERINLVFVGRYDRTKGFDLLLKIFDDPRLDRISLWLVGGNIIDDRVEVPSKANIHELGWLSSESVAFVINQVDAVIVPSRSEGFGLVALEAMRGRKAIIASAVGGLKELVQEGVNGRFIDIDDMEFSRATLLRLDKGDLDRMGGEGKRIFLANYSWDRSYAQWRSLVSELSRMAEAISAEDDLTLKHNHLNR